MVDVGEEVYPVAEYDPSDDEGESDEGMKSENSGSRLDRDVVVALEIPPLDLSSVVTEDDLLSTTARCIVSVDHGVDEESVVRTLKDFLTKGSAIVVENELASTVRVKDEAIERSQVTVTKLHSSVNEYKRKIIEMSEQLRKNDIVVDMLRRQLSRCQSRVKTQRLAFIKELTILREQLLKAAKLGDEFKPDWMTFVDWSKTIIEEDDEGDDETASMVPQKDFDAMKSSLEEEIRQLRLQKKDALDSAASKVEEITAKLEQSNREQETIVENMEKRFEEEKANVVEQQEMEMQSLKDEMAEQEERMRGERDEAEAVIREEYEEQISELRVNLDDMKEKYEDVDRQLSEERAMREQRMASMREELEEESKEKMEGLKHEMQEAFEKSQEEYTERVQKLEEEKNSLSSKMENATLIVEQANMSLEDATASALAAIEEQATLAKNGEGREEDKVLIAELKEEMEKLKNENEELKLNVGMNAGAMDQMKEGIQKDDDYAKEIAQQNWGLVKTQVKLKFGVDEVKKRGSKEPDYIAQLDVWDRLQERYQLLVEKARERKNYLLVERASNLEKVLAAMHNIVENMEDDELSSSRAPYPLSRGSVFLRTGSRRRVPHSSNSTRTGTPRSEISGSIQQ